MSETLYLKWGTVKGWEDLSDASAAALQKWADFGVSMSATTQRDTTEQKQALCDAIDVVASGGGVIWNDWNGEEMTADAAKAYVMGYGHRSETQGDKQ
ncbi:MAG: hypothetical protein CMK96_06255 [Pseudomonas sp.]|nr:hypothetical protein [Pseudomonas sp.]QDP67216.1 MAG: hypothetical protein GOVbin7368_7 [Prokaryotic dsDNA virus sp.]|tara:strand:- start:35035 stop:35328 length:294 start_codon:yes stop_codon:yes gene_type:complete